MASLHSVFVFGEDSSDFSTTGLVGDLMPIEATFTEEKNGVSEVVIKLPYDSKKKWRSAVVGNLIKCEVPVRVPPVIDNDEFSSSVDEYDVNNN